jgi:peptidoglycan/LPS O-acetylase OafA/YrhL
VATGVLVAGRIAASRSSSRSTSASLRPMAGDERKPAVVIAATGFATWARIPANRSGSPVGHRLPATRWGLHVGDVMLASPPVIRGACTRRFSQCDLRRPSSGQTNDTSTIGSAPFVSSKRGHSGRGGTLPDRKGNPKSVSCMANEKIPSLDGARAVSIAFVVVAHLGGSGTFPAANHLWRLDLGNLGVRTFFVISGFLITTLLLNERRASGTVSLRNFYARRFLRIVPAYYAFLIATIGLRAAGLAKFDLRELPSVFLYFSNYRVASFTIGHSWSLAVEEQFYLIWPLLLVVAGVRRAVVGAAAIVVIAPILRVLAEVLPAWPTNPRYAFETVADALAAGCLLAVLRESLWRSSVYRRIVGSSGVFVALACVLAFDASERLPVLWASVGISALNVTIAMTLDRCMRFPDAPEIGWLNTRPAIFVGGLSYSLYLWQQVFLDPRLPVSFPLSILGIFAMALFSRRYIERPFLKLRRAFPPAADTPAKGIAADSARVETGDGAGSL